jgi:hypothetical protein
MAFKRWREIPYTIEIATGPKCLDGRGGRRRVQEALGHTPNLSRNLGAYWAWIPAHHRYVPDTVGDETRDP